MSDVTIEEVRPPFTISPKDLFWGFMYYRYGKVGGVVLFLLLGAREEGLDIYEMADHPLLRDGSPTLEANVLRLRVAICALKKKMKDDPYTRDYEIKNSQKNNMETGRYVLTKKTA